MLDEDSRSPVAPTAAAAPPLAAPVPIPWSYERRCVWAVAVAFLLTTAIHVFHDSVIRTLRLDKVGLLRKAAQELPPPAPSEDVKWMLEKRIEHYRSLTEKLNLNLRIVLVLSVLAMAALRLKEDEFALPWSEEFRIRVPREVAFVALSLGIVYFHLQFGFILNAAIHDRLSIGATLKLLGSERPGIDRWPPPHGLMILLEDQNLMDVWFVSNERFLADQMPVLGVVLASIAETIFGVFYGLAHALAIFLVIRLGQLPNPRKSPLVQLSMALTIFATGLLILSHLLFGFGGNHPNKFQYAALGSVVLWTFALTKLLPATLVPKP